MAWLRHTLELLPGEPGALQRALVRMMKTGEWKTNIPKEDVTPELIQRLRRIANMTEVSQSGSFYCSINAQGVIVTIRPAAPISGDAFDISAEKSSD
jgi:hypothetical protein